MSATSEQTLLQAARGGDQDAFRRLVEPHRGKLQAHCYRMLGSLHDAEDALQETLVKAWRGLAKFNGRSALSSWLYRIATNTCLNAIKRRPARVLPLDYGFASSDPHDAAGQPLVESLWVEPYPEDAFGGLDEGLLGADARYEQRESIELAFVAALQHLPANQRAALLLTEVLGYSAKEAAAMLETTTQSLNSALQRARKAIEEKVPERSQQATLRALGDAELNTVVSRYLTAMEAGDVGGVVSLLTQDATWSMPPQPAWFRGHADIGAFLEQNPFKWFTWKLVPIRANGQPAFACYTRDERQRWRAHAINVLDLEPGTGRISSVVTFLDVTRRGVTGEGFSDFSANGLFERFGVPAFAEA